MLVNKLPDGCSSQAYADKCNLLFNTHLPYFSTIKLEKETLSAVYLKFMPAALSGDARQLEDSLRAEKKFDNPEETKTRATRRVGAAADPAVEHARLAYALGVGPKPVSGPVAGAPPQFLGRREGQRLITSYCNTSFFGLFFLGKSLSLVFQCSQPGLMLLTTANCSGLRVATSMVQLPCGEASSSTMRDSSAGAALSTASSMTT